MTTNPNIRVIRSAPAVVGVCTDRINIDNTASERFMELAGRVAKISATMRARNATRAAVDQAEAMLAEIEQQARAARIALARGR